MFACFGASVVEEFEKGGGSKGDAKDSKFHQKKGWLLYPPQMKVTPVGVQDRPHQNPMIFRKVDVDALDASSSPQNA